MTTVTLATSSRWIADAESYDAWFDRPWGSYATLGIDRVEIAEFTYGAVEAGAPETLHEFIRPVL